MPSKWPAVMCPGCQVPMGVKMVSTGKPGEMGQVIYACVICRTETVRHHKVPEQPRSTPPEDRKSA